MFVKYLKSENGILGYFLVFVAGIILIILFITITNYLPKAAPNYDRIISFFRARQEKERQSLAFENQAKEATKAATACTNYDQNGDNLVNNFDISYVIARIGSTPLASNWDPVSDLNDDNQINSQDIEILTVLANSNLKC